MEIESPPPEQATIPEPTDQQSLRLVDWIWRPWYAKLWWAAVPIYWGGRMASTKVNALTSFYDTLVAGYLAVFCNPLIVLLLLGFGFVRAKLDRGEWILTRNVPERQLRPGDMSDPYSDPTDPRSGNRYLEHMGL